MKKKKMTAEKKLHFGKSAVAVLSASEKEMLAGGLPPVTLDRKCQTYWDTCSTYPYTSPECIPC
ncbi:class I lanthipeptide [Chitinophaga oryzae]|uniref:Class I lanthipeptide n=1 Tax=Chitinophaga oryzae TaxID=2725414 RepID=A0AAE6ZFH3_9BACT|nr:class I lanthipeptide [Chitinophaga oryzae]QJB31828.1 class I lanthipeptide [Chitinophaga oryzae]QJB38306.1 class I lanthipeptide [Chitinophaga oryzae]